MTRMLPPQKLIFVLLTLTLCSAGCSDADPEQTEKAPPVRRAEPSDEPKVLMPRVLRRQLKANENAAFERSGNDIVEARLFQSGVKSIEPLKGLPLRFLDLGMTEVTDLSPIAGMPLKTLILENTTVDDISVVDGMQLEVVHLQNTKVTDLSALAGMPIRELNLMSVPIDNLEAVADLPLQTLWIPQTKVKDISALNGKPMVSLDIEGTEVADISALSGMVTLKRLNISNTKVSDVSALKGLSLQRITLTPGNIKNGMDVLREMSSLGDIRTTMQGAAQSAAEFWAKYDDGVWDSPTESKTGAKPEQSDGAAAKSTASDGKGDKKEGADEGEEAGEKEETSNPDASASQEFNDSADGKELNKKESSSDQ